MKALSISEMISQALTHNAVAHGDECAIISDQNRINYRELNHCVTRLADSILTLNLKKNDVVAIRVYDQINHLICFLALLKLGQPQTSLNPKDPLNAQYLIARSTQSKLIIQEGFYTQESPLALAILNQDYTLECQSEPPQPLTEPVQLIEPIQDKNPPAVVFMGSGTTGNAKKITVDSIHLALLVERDIAIRDFQPGDKHYCLATLHNYTPKRRALGALIKGLTLMMPNKMPSHIIDYCREYKIEHLSLTTSQALSIFDREVRKTNAPRPLLPCTKSLMIGSAPISEPVRKAIKEHLTPQLYVVYGTNEFGEACIAPPKDQALHPGTVGKPCPDVDIHILDLEGKPCDIGKPGRICLSIKEKWQDQKDQITASSIDCTKGFLPKDIGRLTPDGNLIFMGREDDLMIFQGVNIYPREIESILENHPDIAEAAAFPVYIKDRECLPFAAVSLNKSKEITEKELLLFCSQFLGWRKPVGILILENLPRNDAGKILKRALGQHVIQRLQKK